MYSRIILLFPNRNAELFYIEISLDRALLLLYHVNGSCTCLDFWLLRRLVLTFDYFRGWSHFRKAGLFLHLILGWRRCRKYYLGGSGSGNCTSCSSSLTIDVFKDAYFWVISWLHSSTRYTFVCICSQLNFSEAVFFHFCNVKSYLRWRKARGLLVKFSITFPCNQTRALSFSYFLVGLFFTYLFHHLSLRRKSAENQETSILIRLCTSHPLISLSARFSFSSFFSPYA